MEQTDNQYEQVAQSVFVYEETKEIAGETCELKHHKQQNEDLENHCPLKSDHSKPLPYVSNSLMQQAVVTEVLDGGKFYVQAVADQKVSSIQQQLDSLNIKQAPVIGAFNLKKGDIVLGQFTADNSWNRAMVVSGSRGAVQSAKDEFEVFYID